MTLVTRGSPDQVTGGHLYHRRMAEAAPARNAILEFISVSGLRSPFRRARGLVVVDSITAWSVAPWVVLDRRRRPLAAILHQPPGGVGQGRWRTALQRPLDRMFYRRCDLLLVASTALRDGLVRDHGLPAGADARGRAGERPAIGRTRRPTTCGRVDGSPCSASATGCRTRACWNCSTRSRRCRRTMSPCTSPGAPTSTSTTPPGFAPESPRRIWRTVSSCTVPSAATKWPRSTRAPTCSRSRATPRRTERSTARPWRPGSRSSAGGRATCRTWWRTVAKAVWCRPVMWPRSAPPSCGSRPTTTGGPR